VDKCDMVLFRGKWSGGASAEWCSAAELTALVPNADSYAMASDLDGDGKVGTSDLLKLLASLGGAASYNQVADADVTQDGKVNRCDELMLRHNFGKIVGAGSGRRLAMSAEEEEKEMEELSSSVVTMRGKNGQVGVSIGEHTMEMNDKQGKKFFQAEQDSLSIKGQLGIKDTFDTDRFIAGIDGVAVRDDVNRTSFEVKKRSLDIYDEERSRIAGARDAAMEQSAAIRAERGWATCNQNNLPALASQIRMKNFSVDFNFDGAIDKLDLQLLLNNLGSVPANSPRALYDVTADGRVDRCDEIVLRSLYGSPTALPATEAWCSTGDLKDVFTRIGSSQSRINAASVDGTVGNGKANRDDLSAVRSAWGPVTNQVGQRADVTGDGNVDRCDEAVVQAEAGITLTSQGWCSRAVLISSLEKYGTSFTDADVNNDGVVNMADWVKISAERGPVRPGTSTKADINGDGHVDLCDELLFRGAHGTVTLPQPTDDWCSADSLMLVLHKLHTRQSVQKSDLNGDGQVNHADKNAMINAFGPVPPGTVVAADLNNDGVVNRCDLLQVYANFGKRTERAPTDFDDVPRVFRRFKQ